MIDNAPSRLLTWLPYVSLLITIAAFSAGAPAKLAHRRAALPLLVENDFRDEPMMFPIRHDALAWRSVNAPYFRTALALK